MQLITFQKKWYTLTIILVTWELLFIIIFSSANKQIENLMVPYSLFIL